MQVFEMGRLDSIHRDAGKRSSQELGHTGSVLVFSSLVDFLLVAHPFFLAQDKLLDLTGRGLRKLAEFDGRWCLEAGDAILAELYDLPFGGCFPLLQRNE